MPTSDQSKLCHTRCWQLFIAIAVIAEIFLAPATLSLRAQAQAGADKAPITHEAMWLMKRVGAPSPSPDGKWVVLSVVEPAYDEKDQI